MRIHSDFTGGNIRLVNINGSVVEIDNELRDTSRDWFYWAFCVEGAAGETVTFRFNRNLLGYYGPAVSHDLKKQDWLDSRNEDHSFTYTFTQDENKVFFAHDMLYHPERFEEFANTQGLKLEQLCTSRKGRSVPMVRLGIGSRPILLTARHHACEASGSYVLEGVLERLISMPIEDCYTVCIPFVDLDGVVEGDQGKDRTPHDHYEDYISGEKSIYPEVEAIRRWQKENGVYICADFHSPSHAGGEHDHVFLLQNSTDMLPQFVRFGRLLEEALTTDALQYSMENDYPPDTNWNKSNTPCFANYMRNRGAMLAFTIENTYFGKSDNKFTQDRGVALGRCIADALRKYANMEGLNVFDRKGSSVEVSTADAEGICLLACNN